MRRSVSKFIAGAVLAVSAASPAFAAKTVVNTLPAVTSACSLSLPTPDAIACAGYFSGNLLNGSPTDVLNQQQAIDSLPGTFQWNGNWSALANSTNPFYVLDTDPNTVNPGLTNGNQLNFGTTLYGLTIIGAHFGNGSVVGNNSVFWLFDFGTTGAQYVALDNPQGWSNAALYTTQPPPGVPEPATWAMMLLGFGAAGTALRRSRRKTGMLAQIA
ncbi:hypothetical protein GCM10023264_08230 [Sphingomonas daechungensis]